MNETGFNAYLTCLNGLGIRQSAHLTEACAIAFYQQQTAVPIIETLLADDTPQFKLLTQQLALCWLHDGRHYKKLKPLRTYTPTRLDRLSKPILGVLHRTTQIQTRADTREKAMAGKGI
jgi:hypothetical protein